jgi:prefoldin subunit 5
MQQRLSERQIYEMAQHEQAKIRQLEDLFENYIEAAKEVNGSLETLKEIKDHKGKLLVKLGAGVLIEAEINTNMCKINFAENGYVDEKIENAIKKMEQRKTNIEKKAIKAKKELTGAQQKLTQLARVLKQIEAEKKKNFSSSANARK